MNGRFSNAQAVLYDIVLSVQTTLLMILKEQRPTLDKLFDYMCQILGTYLREEGIISKSCSNSELTAVINFIITVYFCVEFIFEKLIILVSVQVLSSSRVALFRIRRP